MRDRARRLLRMTPYGAQFRLVARGLFDYLVGIDPSAVGLVGTLLTLIRSRGIPSHDARRGSVEPLD